MNKVHRWITRIQYYKYNITNNFMILNFYNVFCFINSQYFQLYGKMFAFFMLSMLRFWLRQFDGC